MLATILRHDCYVARVPNAAAETATRTIPTKRPDRFLEACQVCKTDMSLDQTQFFSACHGVRPVADAQLAADMVDV
jgi:hypothetical protein